MYPKLLIYNDMRKNLKLDFRAKEWHEFLILVSIEFLLGKSRISKKSEKCGISVERTSPPSMVVSLKLLFICVFVIHWAKTTQVF